MDTALRLLRARLRQADAREGVRLPTERELASELQIGRRAVRDALARLEAEGIVWRRPGVGTIVAKSTRGSHGQRREMRQYTSPRELMDARLLLEPGIAALAAANATSHDLDELHRCTKRAEGVKDHRAWERWDGALHQAIGRAGHNALVGRLFDLLNTARSHTEWGRLREASLTPPLQATYTRQHKEIIAAIEDRDTELAALRMQEHLNTVKRTLLGTRHDPLGLGVAHGGPARRPGETPDEC